MLYTAVIDRPMHSRHPKHPDMVYPVNYGYIPGLIAGDGAEQDVYVLGVAEPLEAFTGELIAIIHRRDDVEDKWVLAPEGVRFTRKEIMAAVHFQEQHFDSYCVLDERPLTYLRADVAHEDMAFNLVLDHLRALHGYPPERTFGEDILEGAWYFVRQVDKTMLIALDGERPVACAAMWYSWKGGYEQLPPRGERAHLMYVYTVPEYRRSHVIRRMIQLLHREARERGVDEITMNAWEESWTACSVCKDLGYRQFGHDLYLNMER